MKTHIVDENVPRVANDAARISSGELAATPQANLKCRQRCIEALRSLAKSGVVLVDDRGGVLSSYRKTLNFRGQPGVGDAFYRHIANHEFNPKRVKRVTLTTNDERGYELFPDFPGLASFDRDDRIYVALSIAEPNDGILNAVDSDYRNHGPDLKRAGIRIVELCPDCLKEPP